MERDEQLTNARRLGLVVRRGGRAVPGPADRRLRADPDGRAREQAGRRGATSPRSRPIPRPRSCCTTSAIGRPPCRWRARRGARPPRGCCSWRAACSSISGKRYMSMRPQPLPSLDRLVAERFAPPVRREPGRKLRDDRRRVRPRSRASTWRSSTSCSRSSGRGREAAIPILQAIQTHYRYLPDEALAAGLRADRDHAGADRRHLQLLRPVPSLAGRPPRRARLSRHGLPRGGGRTDHPGTAAAPRDRARTPTPTRAACSPSTRWPVSAAAAWRR